MPQSWYLLWKRQVKLCHPSYNHWLEVPDLMVDVSDVTTMVVLAEVVEVGDHLVEVAVVTKEVLLLQNEVHSPAEDVEVTMVVEVIIKVVVEIQGKSGLNINVSWQNGRRRTMNGNNTRLRVVLARNNTAINFVIAKRANNINNGSVVTTQIFPSLGPEDAVLCLESTMSGYTV